MPNVNRRRRIEKLERDHRDKNAPLSVIDVIGMIPEAAAEAIVTRQNELALAGVDGLLIILDR